MLLSESRQAPRTPRPNPTSRCLRLDRKRECRSLRYLKSSDPTKRSSAGRGNHTWGIRGRRWLECVGLIEDILREPFHFPVHLVELMSWFEPGVPLVRGDLQFARHAQGLEGAHHLDRLSHRHTRVVLANQEQRRRARVRDVLQWRLVPIGLNRRVLLP